jgi:hypothetical protein
VTRHKMVIAPLAAKPNKGPTAKLLMNSGTYLPTSFLNPRISFF